MATAVLITCCPTPTLLAYNLIVTSSGLLPSAGPPTQCFSPEITVYSGFKFVKSNVEAVYRYLSFSSVTATVAPLLSMAVTSSLSLSEPAAGALTATVISYTFSSYTTPSPTFVVSLIR